MVHTSRISVAKVAAVILASSWAAVAIASPAGADVNSQCAALPASDLCHRILNVPVDPAVPPYPEDSFPSADHNPATDPPYVSSIDDPSNPNNPNNLNNAANAASPLNPSNLMNPNNPANPANPMNPINQSNPWD